MTPTTMHDGQIMIGSFGRIANEPKSTKIGPHVPELIWQFGT